jgi:alginate O-acetyltransferase complex protein AlgI
VLFNSYTFLFGFLPPVVVAYYALRRQPHRLALVVAASYVFYAWAAWWFPLLMVSATAISFTAGRAIEGLPDGGRRRLVLAAGVTGCLLLLAVFKYAAFGAHYSSRVLDVLTGRGLPGLEELTHGILLPAGISFYTFEAVSYMVDVYRRELEAERSPLRYMLFISFFPHLIAGPIVRYGVLRPQLERRVRFDAEAFRTGVLLLVLGLAKKILVADQISLHVDPALRDPGSLGLLSGWAAMVAYAFQIYFDFSGYTDMALGLATLFGIALPWNFDRPYSAVGIRDFWRRWHVTLSRWLRDYLYIPLGGNRRGPARRDLNLLATMALGGLWHGAAITFGLWGLYHGVLLVLEHRLSRLRLRLPRPVAVAVTFLLVTIGWCFFRMTTLGGVKAVLAALFGLHGIGTVAPVHVLPLALVLAYVWLVPEERTWSLRSFGSARVAAVALVAVAALVSINETRVFLYFRF